MIRLLLVYDNYVLLRLLEWVLHDTSEVHVVARARTASEACDVVRDTSPNVILIDYDLEALELLLDCSSRAKVLIFSAVHDAIARQQAIKLGAHGIVGADTPALLLRAIRVVHSGELWVNRADAAALIDEMRSRTDRRAQLEQLTGVRGKSSMSCATAPVMLAHPSPTRSA